MVRQSSSLLFSLMMVGCATESFLWQRYTADDFPSQVHSMTTILGSLIDADHAVSFGSWTIGFGDAKPQASYDCPQDAACYITITNLKCERSSMTHAACELRLTKDGTCKLIIPERQETFRMYCPFDVTLEQTSEEGKDKTAIRR